MSSDATTKNELGSHNCSSSSSSNHKKSSIREIENVTVRSSPRHWEPVSQYPQTTNEDTLTTSKRDIVTSLERGTTSRNESAANISPNSSSDNNKLYASKNGLQHTSSLSSSPSLSPTSTHSYYNRDYALKVSPLVATTASTTSSSSLSGSSVGGGTIAAVVSSTPSISSDSTIISKYSHLTSGIDDKAPIPAPYESKSYQKLMAAAAAITGSGSASFGSGKDSYSRYNSSNTTGSNNATSSNSNINNNNIGTDKSKTSIKVDENRSPGNSIILSSTPPSSFTSVTTTSPSLLRKTSSPSRTIVDTTSLYTNTLPLSLGRTNTNTINSLYQSDTLSEYKQTNNKFETNQTNMSSSYTSSGLGSSQYSTGNSSLSSSSTSTSGGVASSFSSYQPPSYNSSISIYGTLPKTNSNSYSLNGSNGPGNSSTSTSYSSYTSSDLFSTNGSNSSGSYRLQYSSTNPFLNPFLNPPSDESNHDQGSSVFNRSEQGEDEDLK